MTIIHRSVKNKNKKPHCKYKVEILQQVCLLKKNIWILAVNWFPNISGDTTTHNLNVISENETSKICFTLKKH